MEFYGFVNLFFKLFHYISLKGENVSGKDKQIE